MEAADLGIVTTHSRTNPPFPEQKFFQRLIKKGKEDGVKVIVFHPNDILFAHHKVNAFTLDSRNKWASITASIPSLIYDRCFYVGKRYNQLYKPYIDRLLRLKGVSFLGIGLKGKWQMYQLVGKHPVLSSFLPPTQLLAGMHQLKSWFNEHPSIILKPLNGSLGRGIMKVTPSGPFITVEGRGGNNTPFHCQFPSFQSFTGFFHSHADQWKYLIQPYLTLTTAAGTPFDLRILMQKDGSGKWACTGKAMRLGSLDSITSNLHGGGKAISFLYFLRKNYTAEQAEKIKSEIAILEQLLPSYLEEQHGPLVELGIDVGIDQDQNVWLIEVNSRPGRQIFEQLRDKEAVLRSQLNPLFYAKYLMQSR